MSNVFHFPTKPGTVDEIVAGIVKAHAEGRISQLVCIALDNTTVATVHHSNATAMQIIFMQWYLEKYTTALCRGAGLNV